MPYRTQNCASRVRYGSRTGPAPYFTPYPRIRYAVGYGTNCGRLRLAGTYRYVREHFKLAGTAQTNMPGTVRRRTNVPRKGTLQCKTKHYDMGDTWYGLYRRHTDISDPKMSTNWSVLLGTFRTQLEPCRFTFRSDTPGPYSVP